MSAVKRNERVWLIKFNFSVAFFLSLSEEKRREKRKTTNLYDFLRMRQNGSAARLDLHLLLEVLRQI